MYFYGIKIQTNIKQNLVEKYMEKLQFKKKFNFLFFFLFFGSDPTIWVGPNYSGWANLEYSLAPESGILHANHHSINQQMLAVYDKISNATCIMHDV